MNSASPILKKPKLEHDVHHLIGTGEDTDARGEGTSIAEQEEAFVALIEHRTREVEHLKKRISYYTSQVVLFLLLLLLIPQIL